MRLALRQLAKNPVFSAIAILVLALGIGANSAMFSLVNALLLRPLAVHHPEELVGVYSREARPEGGYRAFSYPNYVDLRAGNTVFAEVAAYNMAMAGVQEGEVTRRTFAGIVSANFLRTFGVRPALGRDFLPEEERPNGGATVVMISHPWWQRHGADPGVIGRSLTLNGQPFTIIGVTPEGFSGTTAGLSPDLWVPLGANELVVNDFAASRRRSLDERANHQLMLVARLRPGLSGAAARPQLEGLARQLAEAYPAENRDFTLEIHPLPRLAISTNPQNNRELLTLAGLLLPMSGVVLLVACLNLANMFLARGATRRKEIAVRLALGSGRGRIIRQLLAEGLVLSLVGGILGLFIAWAATHLLAGSLNGRLPGLTLVIQAEPDVRVIAFTLAFCFLATLLFALLPASRLARTEVALNLKDQGTDLVAGHGRTRLLAPRNLLVAGQLALALTLLTIACLFVRGARNAAVADPGFSFDEGLLVELDASLAGFDEAQGRALYLEALQRIRALPGVASASLASSIPFGMFYDGRRVRPVGGYPPGALRGANTGGRGPTVGISRSDADSRAPADADEESVAAGFVIVAHDYFKTVGLSLLKGRDFDRLEETSTNAAPLAVVDTLLARRLWGEEDPVGRQFETVERGRDGAPQAFQVIGVVSGVRQNIGDEQEDARFYVPLGQQYQAWMNLQVRLDRPGPESAAVMMKTLRSELRRVNDRLPVLSIQTLRRFHNEGMVMWGFRTAQKLFGAFAALALFLSVVGIYAVRAYLVARRTREIGIRVALGASRRQVLHLVLREGLRLTGLGLAAGVVLSLGAGRLLSSQLYRVGWADPVSLGASLVILGAAALIACWIPARRAAVLDPLKALRQE